MTRKLMFGILAICGLSITLLAQNALETYQRALVQEQAAGNLKEAIQLYQRVAQEAAGDRTLAARALIRAAASQEKLGEPQAIETYTEVIRTYTEQREQVAIAEARLTALRRSTAATRQGASAGAVRTDVSAVIDPVLATYCVSCHNQNRRVANLAFETINTHNVAENTRVWENVLRRLRARRDPPPDQPRPNEGTYQSLISTLELALDQAYPANASLNTAERATEIELATRMAKFIWNGSPDEILLDVAQRGRLRDAAVLEQQVRRMLRDPKSMGLVTNFFERSPLRAGLDKVKPDPARFPDFDEALRQAFGNETRLFLGSQLRDDRDALELWTANYTFVNERLARHYGLPNVSGNDFRRVTLTDTARSGILGHGSLLTVTSFPERTSPTMRGANILSMFLGTLPPDPPPSVAPMKTGSNEDGRPMRERVADHTSNPACANCHRIFEPLGFALSNFDAIGAWQRNEGGVPIDASGAFIDGTKFNGPAEFRAGLLKYRDAYYHNITQFMLGYAIGRQAWSWRLYDYEMPAVRAIVREAAGNDYRWSSIIAGIVKSTPFQMRNLVP